MPNLIADELKEHGVKVSHLAAALGEPRKKVSQILSGDREPTLKFLLALEFIGGRLLWVKLLSRTLDRELGERG